MEWGAESPEIGQRDELIEGGDFESHAAVYQQIC
jgi:hypothetical protein